jgi:O-antigen/teichoic acid export membrane protein
MTRSETAGNLTQIPQAKEAPAQRGGRAVVQSIFIKLGITLLNAGTGIITARLLMPLGRGELAAMILPPTLLSFITTLGIPSSIIYVLRQKKRDPAECITTGLSMTLLISSISTLAGIFLLPFWLGRQYSSAVIHAGQWYLATTPIMALGMTGRAILEAKGQFSKSNQLLLLTPGVTLAGLLALFATHRLTPFTAAACYTVGAIPALFLMLAWVFPFMASAIRFHVKAVRELLGYGLRSFWIDLLGTMALQVDQVLVINMLSPSAMGLYGVMLSLSRMFNLFQLSVVMVLFPKAAGQPTETVIELAESSARLSTMVTGACCAIAAMFGPTLLRLLYGAEYAADARSLRLLLLEVTISGAVLILAQAFMALGHPGVVAILQGIGLSVTIPMMLWLVPRLGVQGAAISLLVSTLARFVLVYLGFRFILKVRTPQLWPRIGDFRILTDQIRKVIPRTA